MPKKEKMRTYRQSYVPNYGSSSYPSRYGFGTNYFRGLDTRDIADSGYLSDCLDIDVTKFPALEPIKQSTVFKTNLSSGGDSLILGYKSSIYFISTNTAGDILTVKRYSGSNTYTATYNVPSGGNTYPDSKLSASVFCEYEGEEGEIYYQYEAKYALVIAPFMVKVDADFTSSSATFTVLPNCPEFEAITVHNSRLWGSVKDMIVCSSQGTVMDWTTDSPESTDASGENVGGYSDTHSWYTKTQSNVESSGAITALTSFDGHPIIFKDDYMHIVYNNKNPFRLSDIAPVGCVGSRALCIIDSTLYFASHDGIYSFGGGYPRKISDRLPELTGLGGNTVLAANDGVLYIYPELSYVSKTIYTFCPDNGNFAKIRNPHVSSSGTTYYHILSFAVFGNELYSLGADGEIRKYYSSNLYSSDWFAETAIMLQNTPEDKRLHTLRASLYGYDSGIFSIGIKHENGATTNVYYNSDVDKETSAKISLRKFDSLYHKLIFSGDGYVKVRSYTVTYSVSGRQLGTRKDD